MISWVMTRKPVITPWSFFKTLAESDLPRFKRSCKIYRLFSPSEDDVKEVRNAVDQVLIWLKNVLPDIFE
jgi:hypothetical protein